MIAKKIVVTSLGLVAAAAAIPAQAADCVLDAKAVVIAGSSAIEPVIKGTAGPLLAQGNIDVFYYGPGSCTGTNSYLNGDDLGGKSANHYDAAGNKTTCTLPMGTKADLGVSDVFVEVCQNGTKPAGVGDF